MNKDTFVFSLPGWLISGLLLISSSGFSQDTLKLTPVWKLAECMLDDRINKNMETLHPDYNPATDSLELVMIDYNSASASSILTYCRIRSLSEWLKTEKELEIKKLTPIVYRLPDKELRKRKPGTDRITYLVIHRK